MSTGGDENLDIHINARNNTDAPFKAAENNIGRMKRTVSGLRKSIGRSGILGEMLGSLGGFGSLAMAAGPWGLAIGGITAGVGTVVDLMMRGEDATFGFAGAINKAREAMGWTGKAAKEAAEKLAKGLEKVEKAQASLMAKRAEKFDSVIGPAGGDAVGNLLNEHFGVKSNLPSQVESYLTSREGAIEDLMQQLEKERESLKKERDSVRKEFRKPIEKSIRDIDQRLDKARQELAQVDVDRGRATDAVAGHTAKNEFLAMPIAELIRQLEKEREDLKEQQADAKKEDRKSFEEALKKLDRRIDDAGGELDTLGVTRRRADDLLEQQAQQRRLWEQTGGKQGSPGRTAEDVERENPGVKVQMFSQNMSKSEREEFLKQQKKEGPPPGLAATESRLLTMGRGTSPELLEQRKAVAEAKEQTKIQRKTLEVLEKGGTGPKIVVKDGR